ncbi:MAG: glycosyltransferase family 2 protein [Acidimicrobiia bacterium]|nr:glycosyltransferase family 2 protein [Acidimicrobiia bacterium]
MAGVGSPHSASGVAGVVITHRGPTAMLRRCLESISRADGPRCTIVVDNGAHASVPRDDYGPGVGEVLRVENRGFGAAFNAGVARVGELAAVAGRAPAYIALLNDDVEVAIDWLAPLVTQLDGDHSLGAVQPKLLLAGTSPPKINSLGVRFDGAGAGSDIGYGEVDGTAYSTSRDIAVFTGGAVLFRRAFLDDLGGFDERYFLYYEDVDLALRGAERSWHFRCEPASTVVHDQGSSSGDLGDEVHYLRERNRIWTTIRFRGATTVGRSLWLSARRVRHRPRLAHTRALAAGIAAAPRLLAERRRAGAGR